MNNSQRKRAETSRNGKAEAGLGSFLDRLGSTIKCTLRIRKIAAWTAERNKGRTTLTPVLYPPPSPPLPVSCQCSLALAKPKVRPNSKGVCWCKLPLDGEMLSYVPTDSDFTMGKPVICRVQISFWCDLVHYGGEIFLTATKPCFSRRVENLFFCQGPFEYNIIRTPYKMINLKVVV